MILCNVKFHSVLQIQFYNSLVVLEKMFLKQNKHFVVVVGQ